MKKAGFLLLIFFAFNSIFYGQSKSDLTIEMQKKEFEQALLDAEEQYNENVAQYLQDMQQEAKDEQQTALKNTKDEYVIFGIIVAIFLGALVFVGLFWIRQQKIYQVQLDDTFTAMQSQHFSFQESNSESEEIPFRQQVMKMTKADEILGRIQNVLSVQEQEQEEENIKEHSEIEKLLYECKKISLQIEEVTSRTNISSQVAELVLKITMRLGYSETDGALFYAAALVYDIGFLDVDSQIFKAEKMTEEMFDEIKTHTEIGQKKLSFVGKKYKAIFIDAVGKHHENLDGTGYPNRLINYEIPYIARVIRVCESYVALISKRAYKNSMNKNSAINELRNSTSRYDKKLVDALEAII